MLASYTGGSHIRQEQFRAQFPTRAAKCGLILYVRGISHHRIEPHLREHAMENFQVRMSTEVRGFPTLGIEI